MQRLKQVRAAACAATAVCSVLSSVSLADVAYDITALGLTDAQHRRTDGYCQSNWLDYNDKGGVIGYSKRWSGSTYTGESAWFYENKVITRIGLWDPAHTRSDGYAYSTPLSITDRHQVLGRSTQYVGTYEGRTAWVYSKGATQVIGLTDAAHTATDGMQYSYGFRQNADGEVIGESNQYKGNGYIGKDAWIFTGGETLRIGRSGSDAYAADGHCWNEPEYISDGGYVAGWGGTYSPNGVYLGHTAWRYHDGQTQDIGLFDAEHISSDGQRDGRTMGVNNAGDVIGYNSRYSGTAPRGVTAWVYHAGTAQTLGLTSGIHTAPDGGRVSEPTRINNAGQAAGWSTQYVGSAQGASTWFYDGTTTRQIGLTDAAHTLSNGTGYSIVVALNDRGTVAGVSQQRVTRYDGIETRNGLSAFHYEDGVTTRIGLLDAKHVTSDGWSANTISLMNSAGQIAGIADRVNGYSGATAWFYDPAGNTTYPLEFSTSSTGYAESVVQYLADDGVCLGTYDLFSGAQSLGEHAFYWSIDEGFHDLGSLEAGSLGVQGWERIYDGIVINGNGDVIATGILGNGLASQSSLVLASGASQLAGVWGDIPVMLTVVPEPSSAMVMLGLSGFLCMRVRTKR